MVNWLFVPPLLFGVTRSPFGGSFGGAEASGHQTQSAVPLEVPSLGDGRNSTETTKTAASSSKYRKPSANFHSQVANSPESRRTLRCHELGIGCGRRDCYSSASTSETEANRGSIDRMARIQVIGVPIDPQDTDFI